MNSSQEQRTQDRSNGRKLLERLEFRYHAFRTKGKPRYNAITSARKEVRLLELYPGHGKELIRCFLRIEELHSKSCPAYETVSLSNKMLTP